MAIFCFIPLENFPTGSSRRSHMLSVLSSDSMRSALTPLGTSYIWA